MKNSILGIAMAAFMPLMFAQTAPPAAPSASDAKTPSATASKTTKHSKKPVKKPVVKKSTDVAKPAASAK